MAFLYAILGASSDPQIFIPAGFGLASAIAAVLATARYIKRTEDDTVDNLREQTQHLEERCARCETEAAELRVDNVLLHRHIGFLVRAMLAAGLEVPELPQ